MGSGVCVQGGQLGPRSAWSCPQCAVVCSEMGCPRGSSLTPTARAVRRTPHLLLDSLRQRVGRFWHLELCGPEAMASVHTLAGLPEDTGVHKPSWGVGRG